MPLTGYEIPLLKIIPPSRLADSLIVRKYGVGSHIFEQGDPTSGLWFVIEGA